MYRRRRCPTRSSRSRFGCHCLPDDACGCGGRGVTRHGVSAEARRAQRALETTVARRSPPARPRRLPGGCGCCSGWRDDLSGRRRAFATLRVPPKGSCSGLHMRRINTCTARTRAGDGCQSSNAPRKANYRGT